MQTPVRYLFSQINYLRGKKSRTILQQTGLSAGQPKILDYLSFHEGCTQRELAAGCGVEAATMSVLLNGLEEGGLIEKRGDASNRRIVSILFTARGRQKLLQIRSIIETLERHTFDDAFTEDERRQFRAFLERYCQRWRELEASIESMEEGPHADRD